MTLVKNKSQLKKAAHAKKRYGEHHKLSSRHYIKTYWPYLPMILIVIGSIAYSGIKPAVLGASSNLSIQSLLTDTNEQRAKYGDQPLNINAQLEVAAQTKATEMTEDNFWSHVSPSGQTPWQLLAASGYNYQQAGENLAYGFSDAGSVITAWMNSPEHRQNVLNSSFSDVGFGISSSSNFVNQGPETIVVAEYGDPAPTSTVANISFNVTPKTGVDGTTTPSVNAPLKSTLVSRISQLSGQGTWLVVLISFITGVLVCYLIYRNLRRVKKLIRDGEKFASSHILIDLLIVMIICAGYILTRSAGAIH